VTNPKDEDYDMMDEYYSMRDESYSRMDDYRIIWRRD
jgi:hypothetical protein